MRKLLLVLILILSLFGCQSKSATEIVISNEPEVVDETVSETTTPENEETDLTNSDLLMSLGSKQADNLKVVSTVSSDGVVMIITTYYSGNKMRIETEMGEDSVKNIMIILEDEKVMYNYSEGSNTGIKMINMEDGSAEDMGLMDNSEDILWSIQSQDNPNLIARKDTLNGEEVVYIETESYDEDVDSTIIKMWYSTKYGVPLKYQLISEDEVFMESNSVISDDKVASSMFEVPADITFTEVDISAMS